VLRSYTYTRCVGMLCRMHTFYAIQLPGSGTRYSAYLQYQSTDYEVTHIFVKCTQNFRANRPILMTCVTVAFIFSSFYLQFFVQPSVFAGEREMRSFILTQGVLRGFMRISYQSCSSMCWPFPVLHQFATYVKIF